MVAAQAEEESLHANLLAIVDRPPPESKGLDVSNKRSINLMILAFAQQLYLQFGDNDFATLVKEASEKSVGSVNKIVLTIHTPCIMCQNKLFFSLWAVWNMDSKLQNFVPNSKTTFCNRLIISIHLYK